jgi:hypothetical protein
MFLLFTTFQSESKQSWVTTDQFPDWLEIILHENIELGPTRILPTPAPTQDEDKWFRDQEEKEGPRERKRYLKISHTLKVWCLLEEATDLVGTPGYWVSWKTLYSSLHLTRCGLVQDAWPPARQQGQWDHVCQMCCLLGLQLSRALTPPMAVEALVPVVSPHVLGSCQTGGSCRLQASGHPCGAQLLQESFFIFLLLLLLSLLHFILFLLPLLRFSSHFILRAPHTAILGVIVGVLPCHYWTWGSYKNPIDAVLVRDSHKKF